MSTARIPDGTPPAVQLPEPTLQVIVTFTSPGMQRAFADWVASGEYLRLLWQWMGIHGYHA